MPSGFVNVQLSRHPHLFERGKHRHTAQAGDAIIRGVIDIRDMIFFVSIIGVFLFATMVVVDLKKGA